MKKAAARIKTDQLLEVAGCRVHGTGHPSDAPLPHKQKRISASGISALSTSSKPRSPPRSSNSMPRNPILLRQYKAAYSVGLDMHDGQIGITEGLDRLASSGLKRNTAADLVYNVARMLRGERYTRALSVPVTDDYLSWIRRDRGDGALRKAIAALNGHIRYYEQLRKIRLPGLRSLMAKHKAFLTSSGSSTISLEWDDKESRGYVDVIPLEWFSRTGSRLREVHTTRHRSGKEYHAKCDITVRAKEAELNYAAYRRFNESQQMLIGVARLAFADSDRTALESVQWKKDGEDGFKDVPFLTPKFTAPPSPPYNPPSAAASKKARWVRERTGQAKFRRDLKSAYNQRCCVTGCTVSEALEGAHIDPYKGPASHNLRNGLLLRRDLHALFDKHLISFEPESLTTHVAEVARATGGYADLDGKKLTLPCDSSHRPDQGALERHWQQFRSKPASC